MAAPNYDNVCFHLEWEPPQRVSRFRRCLAVLLLRILCRLLRGKAAYSYWLKISLREGGA